MNRHIGIILQAVLLLSLHSCRKNDDKISEGPGLETIVSNLQFAEGPAYLNGDLFFTDIEADRIYRWNKYTGLQVYRENSGGANGICPDNDGNLIVCEGENKRIISISPDMNIQTVTDKFGDKPYNEPNDVWVSQSGNIYFTDPVFTGTPTQDGEHVYCVLKPKNEVIRVIDDMVRPNGITGNEDGTKLYVADYGASKIYQYSIQPDGTLSDKQLFASERADGIKIDSEGNIYAAGIGIMIFNSAGQMINTITVPGTPTNICISEEEITMAFITTHTNVYKMIINYL